MNSILHKIKSFPKRKSNRQLLADLLNEYPIETTKNYHSLPIMKSPTEIPTNNSLLIASAFQQTDEITEYDDDDTPMKRKPTPYKSKQPKEDQQEDDEGQQQLDLRKKEIKQLKKIVKIQKKQLDYLLSRSSDNYYMYSYYEDDYGTSYPLENKSHSIPIPQKDETVNRSQSLPSLSNTNSMPSLYTRYSQDSTKRHTVPTMNHRYNQEKRSYSQDSAPITSYSGYNHPQDSYSYSYAPPYYCNNQQQTNSSSSSYYQDGFYYSIT